MVQRHFLEVFCEISYLSLVFSIHSMHACLVTVLHLVIENTAVNTIDTLGKLIPLNIKRLSCILIGCYFFYGIV